jgi:mono/diheme cytochrome c family protein
MRAALLGALATVPVFAQSVTYTRDIAPIFQQKCRICHRPNDIAPFSLDSFEAAFDWKDDIKFAVQERRMPPWKPVAGHGEFRGNFGLSSEERDLIASWVNQGAARGDDGDVGAGEPPAGEWVLGNPDMTLEMPEPFSPPTGKDLYRCFVMPTGFDRTTFVSAADILPGDRRIVHHVILYLDPTGVSERLDEQDPGPGYTCFGGPGFDIDAAAVLRGDALALTGWAPGTRAAHLPDGVALQVPPKARIVAQVHYYVRRGSGTDQTRVGLYFSKSAVEKRLIWVPALNTRLNIPAGAAKHTEVANFAIPPLFDAHLINIFPHMHLLGTQIKAERVGLGGRSTEPLIYIDNWDFNWQGPYQYVDPVPLPALSTVRVTCTFDNSASNPRNPNNPLKPVRWGEGTEDEMCLAFLGITLDREKLQ